MAGESHRKTVEEKWERRKEDEPAKDDDEDASIHWVSHIVVEASNDQVFGGIEWCRGPLAHGCKIPETPGIDCATEDEKKRGEQQPDS